MKNKTTVAVLFAFLFLSFTALGDPPPTATPGEGVGTRGGGETVDLNGRPALRDLVRRASGTCIFQPWSVVDPRQHRRVNQILEALNDVYPYFKDKIEQELNRLRFCFTRAGLVDLGDDDLRGVTIYTNRSQQVAIRINHQVFVKERTFQRMSRKHQAYLLVHEALHSFFPFDLPLRMERLRRTTYALEVNETARMSPEVMGIQIQENVASLPHQVADMNQIWPTLRPIIQNAQQILAPTNDPTRLQERVAAQDGLMPIRRHHQSAIEKMLPGDYNALNLIANQYYRELWNDGSDPAFLRATRIEAIHAMDFVMEVGPKNENGVTMFPHNSRFSEFSQIFGGWRVLGLAMRYGMDSVFNAMQNQIEPLLRAEGRGPRDFRLPSLVVDLLLTAIISDRDQEGATILSSRWTAGTHYLWADYLAVAVNRDLPHTVDQLLRRIPNGSITSERMNILVERAARSSSSGVAGLILQRPEFDPSRLRRTTLGAALTGRNRTLRNMIVQDPRTQITAPIRIGEQTLPPLGHAIFRKDHPLFNMILSHPRIDPRIDLNQRFGISIGRANNSDPMGRSINHLRQADNFTYAGLAAYVGNTYALERILDHANYTHGLTGAELPGQGTLTTLDIASVFGHAPAIQRIADRLPNGYVPERNIICFSDEYRGLLPPAPPVIRQPVLLSECTPLEIAILGGYRAAYWALSQHANYPVFAQTNEWGADEWYGGRRGHAAVHALLNRQFDAIYDLTRREPRIICTRAFRHWTNELISILPQTVSQLQEHRPAEQQLIEAEESALLSYRRFQNLSERTCR